MNLMKNCSNIQTLIQLIQSLCELKADNKNSDNKIELKVSFILLLFVSFVFIVGKSASNGFSDEF